MSNMDNDKQDPIDAALADVEAERVATAVAGEMNDALNELDSHVIMLRGMGVHTSIQLEIPTDKRRDSVEKVGSTKEIGWKVYTDVTDEEGTRRRIDAAKRAAAYATGQVEQKGA